MAYEVEIIAETGEIVKYGCGDNPDAAKAAAQAYAKAIAARAGAYAEAAAQANSEAAAILESYNDYHAAAQANGEK